MPQYRIAGCAFDGEMFDYVVDSPEVFIDFIMDDLKELGGNPNTLFTDKGRKFIIEGEGRLYLIEQLKK